MMSTQTNWTKEKPTMIFIVGFFLAVLVGEFRQVKLLNKIQEKASIPAQNMLLYFSLRDFLEDSCIVRGENHARKHHIRVHFL